MASAAGDRSSHRRRHDPRAACFFVDGHSRLPAPNLDAVGEFTELKEMKAEAIGDKLSD